jgi:hypothetical protein
MKPESDRVIRLRDGRYVLLMPLPLHREHRRGVYLRRTDWIVQVGNTIAWGRTKREAVASIRQKLGAPRLRLVER